MCRKLVSHSPDLQRLVEEGYELEIRSDHLLVGSVPYVNSKKEVKYGTLVSELTLKVDQTDKPSTHVLYFIGEHPCDQHGKEIEELKHGGAQTLAANLAVDRAFSHKPADGYRDYYHKMTTYVRVISGPARALDENATAQTFLVSEVPDDNASVFCYRDTASTRAGIRALSQKLEVPRVAIVGLGGTGSYVLDYLAKTPIIEIHLFDPDEFGQHNAFRAPGAPSVEDLQARHTKVAYLTEIYSRMRRNIIPHEAYIDDSNVQDLAQMSFVFLCLDKGAAKKRIVETLEAADVGFVDVGMGVELVEAALTGSVRTTLSTPEKREHVPSRIDLSEAPQRDEYATNIQIAELNALNAALAVIKWKKTLGFYGDMLREFNSTYLITANKVINDDSV